MIALVTALLDVRNQAGRVKAQGFLKSYLSPENEKVPSVN